VQLQLLGSSICSCQEETQHIICSDDCCIGCVKCFISLLAAFCIIAEAAPTSTSSSASVDEVPFDPSHNKHKGQFALRKLYHETDKLIAVLYTSPSCGPCRCVVGWGSLKMESLLSALLSVPLAVRQSCHYQQSKLRPSSHACFPCQGLLISTS